MVWTFWRRKRITSLNCVLIQTADSSSRNVVTCTCVCPTQTRSNLLLSKTSKVRYWLRTCMILVYIWAGDIDSSGKRSFIFMPYDNTGLKSVNNFRHWALSWASSNHITSSQTIISKTVSASTARIWMRLLVMYCANCIIVAVTEQYCVMGNSCEGFYYVISPATLPFTVLEAWIKHFLRLE
jgi:hypothetical protein